MISTAKFALMGCLILLLAGCGKSDPPIGAVKGTVTLDGQPAADLQVSFVPKSGGLASTAITDANGKYELTYDGRKKGAVVGSHLVQITSAAGGGAAGGDDAVAPIDIPASYNTESTITKEVDAGENTIDLEVITN